MQKCASIFLICSFLTASLSAQSTQAAKQTGAVSLTSSVHTPEDPDVLRETQLGIEGNDYTGLVWWIPFEFWPYSAAKRGSDAEKTREGLKALKEYTVVGAFVAKVGALAGFEYVPPAELQKKIFLRDSDGQDYPALSDVSADAKNLADLMRPILSNAMGRAGENFVMLFFPAKRKDGRSLADEKSKGSFSVVLKD